MTERPTVLAVDDDPATRAFVYQTLSTLDINVHVADAATQFCDKREALSPDLYLLDVELTDGDGLDLGAALNGHTGRPVVFFTVHGDPDRRLRALEAGALDYLTKPMAPREFALRIRNILTQLGHAAAASAHAEAGSDSGKRGEPTPTARRFGPWRFESRRRLLTGDGTAAQTLTAAESVVLEALTASPEQVLSRDDLARALGEQSAARYNHRIVDVLIWRLRKKLGDDGPARRYIATVPSRGYVFTEDVAVA